MFKDTSGGMDHSAPAMVLGRIGLIRSLGRCGITVVLARESGQVFERSSRYVRDFVGLPHPEVETEAALNVLIDYARRQSTRPVAFFNGESDVMLFSRYRERLAPYFHIMLAEHELIKQLVDKSLFARLAEDRNLPSPCTLTPADRGETVAAAERMGFPCVLKPVRQRLWHRPEITSQIGYQKAMLVEHRDDLISILDRLPPISGDTMIQQYIPGEDSDHYDCHMYVDKTGRPRGTVVGHKRRIYPIGFGQGCYTQSVEAPEIVKLCTEAVKSIGYTGAANINLKRDARTGRFLIFEINPRFSLWAMLDAEHGVNLPLMQYLDATDQPLPEANVTRPVRWISFTIDRQAFRELHAEGKLGFVEWIKSILFAPGRLVFHVWAVDDPRPWLLVVWRTVKRLMRRLTGRATVDDCSEASPGTVATSRQAPSNSSNPR